MLIIILIMGQTCHHLSYQKFVVTYIYMNSSVKNNLVKNPSQYEWSSYNDFAFDRNLPIVHKDLLMGIFGKRDDFKKETLDQFYDENSMSKTDFDIEG